MLNEYLMIHKSILPDYYEKVLSARRALEAGGEKKVSAAVRAAGISRSTYYKYKDFILEPSELSSGRNAVLSMLLAHEPGVLSDLLKRISEMGGSILTITQSLPINRKASVTISMDVSAMECSMAQLLRAIEDAPGVENPRIVAVE